MDSESAESHEACRVQAPVKHAAEREEHMFPCSQLQMCSPVVSARHPNPSEFEQQGSHLFLCLLNTMFLWNSCMLQHFFLMPVFSLPGEALASEIPVFNCYCYYATPPWWPFCFSLNCANSYELQDVTQSQKDPALVCAKRCSTLEPVQR